MTRKRAAEMTHVIEPDRQGEADRRRGRTFVHQICGGLQTLLLQPAYRMAQYAAELADEFLRTGETGMDEKISMDCILITADNAGQLETFAVTE